MGLTVLTDFTCSMDWSHWYQYVFNMLGLLISPFVDSLSHEIPVSRHCSLTSRDHDLTHESRWHPYTGLTILTKTSSTAAVSSP